jgi:hypothetical protein
MEFEPPMPFEREDTPETEPQPKAKKKRRLPAWLLSANEREERDLEKSGEKPPLTNLPEMTFHERQKNETARETDEIPLDAEEIELPLEAELPASRTHYPEAAAVRRRAERLAAEPTENPKAPDEEPLESTTPSRAAAPAASSSGAAPPPPPPKPPGRPGFSPGPPIPPPPGIGSEAVTAASAFRPEAATMPEIGAVRHERAVDFIIGALVGGAIEHLRHRKRERRMRREHKAAVREHNRQSAELEKRFEAEQAATRKLRRDLETPPIPERIPQPMPAAEKMPPNTPETKTETVRPVIMPERMVTPEPQRPVTVERPQPAKPEVAPVFSPETTVERRDLSAEKLSNQASGGLGRGGGAPGEPTPTPFNPLPSRSDLPTRSDLLTDRGSGGLARRIISQPLYLGSFIVALAILTALILTRFI